MNHNHANYELRIDFIQDLMRTTFTINGETQVTPIAYEADCPLKYNNFVYRVTLPSATSSSIHVADKPGCVAVPAGTPNLVVRLTNADADGMNKKNRVENEVAVISLVSAALANYEPKVVPAVYGWASAAAAGSQGWILQQLMPGTPADAALDEMDLEGKRGVFLQMAGMLGAIQRYKLPPSIAGYGGVMFDPNGQIVSAEMSSVEAGPWASYEDSFRGRLEIALARAETNQLIQGWRRNAVRERVQAFVDNGLPAQLSSLPSKHDRVVVHGDFSKLSRLIFRFVLSR
ncbi:hypothetical protein LTR85_000055 [Meristemomyces frigidus]|nr:hypothetical protein LTR85_000055 [Meristemomyces frigidus]